MRIQMMGSHGSGGGSGQQTQIGVLAKQGSLYNLTLNEVQNHLSEPLHSMNLDDLLKNVFPQEVNQSAASDIDSTNMTRFMSKKTVGGVWREIQQQKNGAAAQQRQATLGEMTLEDFLVKAGGVADGSDERSDAGGWMFTRGSHCLQQQQHQMPQQTLQDMMRSDAVLDAMYADGRVNTSPLLGTASGSLNSGRKRVAAEEMAEKTVERRQKRMIKNRESAARSRARKQAYTNELENKILRLEEENERLRKQKELDTYLNFSPLPEPKHQLRKSNSGPF